MKKMILLISLLVSTISLSQARLGYSYDDIRREFANDYWYDYFTGYRDWETDRKSTRLNSSH